MKKEKRLEYLKSIAANSLLVILAGLSANGVPLIDQLFAGSISPEHLRVHSFISYIPLFFSTVGRIFGQTVIILLNKVDSQPLKAKLAGSAVSACFLFSIVFVGPILIFPNPFLSLFDPADVSGTHWYLWVQSVSASLMCVVVLMNFVLLSLKRYKVVLKTSVILLVTNTLGNSLDFLLFEQELGRFVGLSIATLGSVFAALVYQLRQGRRLSLLTLSWDSRTFLARAKNILQGEMLYNFVLVAFPFLAGIVIQDTLSKEAATAFHVGFRIAHFFSQPMLAIMPVGAVLMIESWRRQSHASWKGLLEAVRILVFSLSVIPALLLLLNIRLVASHFFNLTASLAVEILAGIIVSSMLQMLTAGSLITMRICERTKFVALVEFLTNYGMLLPSLYLFSDSSISFVTPVTMFLFPAGIKAILVYNAARGEEQRRFQSFFGKRPASQ